MHLKERKPVPQNAKKRTCTALSRMLLGAFSCTSFVELDMRQNLAAKEHAVIPQLCQPTGLLLSATQRPGLCTAQHPHYSLHTLHRPLLRVTILQTAISTSKGRKVKLKRKTSLFIDTQTVTAKPSSCQYKSQIEQICYAGF